MSTKPLFAALALSTAMVTGAPHIAAAQPASSTLIPHRAVYDMNLRDAVAASNIADLRGRLVFDFNGGKCKGYELQSRLVTEVTDRDGNRSMTDLRSSTWEDTAGDQFRFENTNYVGKRLNEQVTGEANKGDAEEKIQISLKEPNKQQLTFDGKALFPTEHSLAILEAAQRGETFLQADVFDGSEQGDKLFKTTTFIGTPSSPDKANAKDAAKPVHARLKSVRSWPVAISYYEIKADAGQDTGLPVYELSFRLYANGVSEDLLINYGTFLVTGTLTRIDYHDAASCDDKGAEAKEKPNKAQP